MRIERALDSDVQFVARNMRAQDAVEFLALSAADDRESLAQALLDRYGGHPDAIAFGDAKGPIGIGAGIEARPNVVTLMFFATDRFPSVKIGIARFMLRNLMPRWRAAGVHRIEAVSIEGHITAHRWIETMGLKREAELRGFGKRGETFHQFAWVAEHVQDH